MHTGEKKILFALFISLAINVIACAFYVYEWQEGLFPFVRIVKEDPVGLVQDVRVPQIESELVALRLLAKNDLFLQLHDTTQVSDGYCKRDYALSVLYSFHHLDVERALGTPSLQKRRLMLSEQESVTLFAGLSGSDYEKLYQFIDQEKWPYTPEGIVLLLQTNPRDPSLVAALMRTDEFQVVKTCLMRNTKIPQELVLELMLASPWQEVAKFSKLKLSSDELLKKHTRVFIKQFFGKKPELATLALAFADPSYASQMCTDEQLLYALRQCKEHPKVARELATAIVKRPRSDKVWAEAKLVLGIPQKAVTIKKAPAPAVKKKDLFHVVKKGESLWSIAKKYNISVELLRRTNKLPTDALKPGTKLLIPN